MDAPGQTQNPNQTQNPGQTSGSSVNTVYTAFEQALYTLKVTQKKQLAISGLNGRTVVAYQSEKGEVASVNAKGKVTAKKKGTTLITAVLSDGTTVICQVEVKKPKVVLKKKTIKVKVGKKTKLKIKKKIKTDKVKKYKVSRKKVAKITKKGVIKGLRKGKTTITVIMKSGVKKKCKVIVK